MKRVFIVVILIGGIFVYAAFDTSTIFSSVEKKDKTATVENLDSSDDDFDNVDENTIKTEVRRYLSEYDIEEAFAKFKKINNTVKDAGLQHKYAHIFGEQLFKAKAYKGMTLCDGSYDYGCIHGFAASVLSTNGTNAMYVLNKKCKEAVRFQSCQHGLGHGLLSYLGAERLFEGLELCERLSKDTPIYGCQDGMFMEYNYPNKSHEEISTARKISREGLYYPCDRASEQHKDLCYFRLAHWWVSVVEYEHIRELEAMCADIEEVEAEHWCYRGLGFIEFYHNEFSAEKTLETCDVFSSAVGRTHCYQAIHLTMNYMADFPDNNASLCSELAPEQKKICMQSVEGY